MKYNIIHSFINTHKAAVIIEYKNYKEQKNIQKKIKLKLKTVGLL